MSRLSRRMVYDGGIVSFLSAFVIITASLIAAGTAKSAGHLDLWGIEGRSDRVIRDIANPVANSSGKNTPPLTTTGKKPAFGDLDPHQDYFEYIDYSKENERDDDGKPTTGSGPDRTAISDQADDSSPTTIIVLSIIAVVMAVIVIVAFVGHIMGWYSNFRPGYDSGSTELPGDKL